MCSFRSVYIYVYEYDLCIHIHIYIHIIYIYTYVIHMFRSVYISATVRDYLYVCMYTYVCIRMYVCYMNTHSPTLQNYRQQSCGTESKLILKSPSSAIKLVLTSLHDLVLGCGGGNSVDQCNTSILPIQLQTS